MPTLEYEYYKWDRAVRVIKNLPPRVLTADCRLSLMRAAKKLAEVKKQLHLSTGSCHPTNLHPWPV